MDFGLLGLPNLAELGRVTLRLVVAAVLGGLIGAEREWVGKAAGLRTHMMVSLGAALFVLVPIETGIGEGDMTRVIQGIATGIGFIGAGTILKRADANQIQGLTTAATIWLTGAVGIAVGAGQMWLGIVCAISAWVILYILTGLDRWLDRGRDHR
ncbi:MAG: MgtC/SapB family protein [Vicinamibacterales bacterium]